MKNTYQAGLFAEWLARMFLRLHFFRILESRHITGRYTGRAEIDIICRRGKLLLFVEVKKRPSAQSGLDAVSFAQHGRLRAAAELYMRRRRYIGLARFDMIVVSGWRIRWLKNAV